MASKRVEGGPSKVDYWWVTKGWKYLYIDQFQKNLDVDQWNQNYDKAQNHLVVKKLADC